MYEGTKGAVNEERAALIRSFGRIATVGASTSRVKPAHIVPERLLALGFDIVPVNPHADELFGVPAARSLADVEGDVDVVQVFRPAEEAPAIARAAVERGARVLWLQHGIRSAQARAIAEDAGLVYVEDTCMWEVANRLKVAPDHRRSSPPAAAPALAEAGSGGSGIRTAERTALSAREPVRRAAEETA